MKLALIGYGAMGRLIETLAADRGHEIVLIIGQDDKQATVEELADKLRAVEAAIDFSQAEAVEKNVAACLLAEVALVVGTTGWQARKDLIRQMIERQNGAMVFGANFSIGVNLFYRIADFASGLLANFSDYEVFIEERHHSRKKDAPSGTALKIEELVRQNTKRNISIAATRAGHIPGTHTLGFDSRADSIELTHTARSREGFAAGAILAAEWIAAKKGFWEFTDVIDEILTPTNTNQNK